MGVFKNIKGKKNSEGGAYILPGNYRVKVKVCKTVESQVKNNQTLFVGELIVLESNNKERPEDAEMSLVVDMTTTKFPNAALGNVNSFLHAAYCSLAYQQGDDPPGEDDIDEEMAEMAISEENPLGGVELILYAFNKPTREGKDFTRLKWSVPEDVQEKAA